MRCVLSSSVWDMGAESTSYNCSNTGEVPRAAALLACKPEEHVRWRGGRWVNRAM